MEQPPLATADALGYSTEGSGNRHGQTGNRLDTGQRLGQEEYDHHCIQSRVQSRCHTRTVVVNQAGSEPRNHKVDMPDMPESKRRVQT